MKLYLSSDQRRVRGVYVRALTLKDEENKFVVHALCDLNSLYFKSADIVAALKIITHK